MQRFRSAAVASDAQDDVDPALVSGLEWSKIAGKRAERTKQLVTKVFGSDLGYRLNVLAVVDEPLRFLTFDPWRYQYPCCTHCKVITLNPKL